MPHDEQSDQSRPGVQITAEVVARLGRLARIELSEAERERLAPQVGDILAVMAEVARVDTSGVEPTSHPESLTNVFRPDRVQPSLPQEQALAMAPATEDERFLVPQILGESA